MQSTATDYRTYSVQAYSGLLEEYTGYTVRVSTDPAGDHCYELVDPCGDTDGEPWYVWADLVSDTEEAICDGWLAQRAISSVCNVCPVQFI